MHVHVCMYVCMYVYVCVCVCVCVCLCVCVHVCVCVCMHACVCVHMSPLIQPWHLRAILIEAVEEQEWVRLAKEVFLVKILTTEL